VRVGRRTVWLVVLVLLVLGASCGPTTDGSDLPSVTPGDTAEPQSPDLSGDRSSADSDTSSSWERLIADLPLPTVGDGFRLYMRAVGKALATHWASDPCVFVDYGQPSETGPGSYVYEFAWYHFPQYPGGQPQGFDTVAQFTV